MKFEHVNYTFDNYSGKKLEPLETVTIETHSYELDEVLECFERFLRGCGYSFDGHIDIVKDNYEIQIQEND